MPQRKLFTYIIHTAIWVLGVAQFFLHDEDLTINHFRGADNNLLIPLIYGTIFNAVIFYVHTYWVIPKFLGKNLYLKYLGGLVGLFFTVTFVESYIDDYMIRQYYPDLNLPFWAEHFGVNAFFHLFFIVASYTYRFAIDWSKHHRLQAQLREEKLGAELSLLKAQIHPHFLFNTLNNLFALARKQQAYETADGISRLAELMRYMIYEADADRITLNQEITYLKDYISLQKLRFHSEDQVDIRFEEAITEDALMIAPMLLITFVENAFKHGISLQKPSFVHIYLEANQSDLLFSVKNSMVDSEADQGGMGSGIGMINVKKRLEILYPFTHDLQVVADNGVYKVVLKLSL